MLELSHSKLSYSQRIKSKVSVLRRQLPLNVSNLSRQSCRLPDSVAPSQRPREASERVGWRQIKLWQIMSDWGAENKFRRGRAKDLSDVWGAAAAVFHIRLLRLWLLGGKRWRAEGEDEALVVQILDVWLMLLASGEGELTVDSQMFSWCHHFSDSYSE